MSTILRQLQLYRQQHRRQGGGLYESSFVAEPLDLDRKPVLSFAILIWTSGWSPQPCTVRLEEATGGSFWHHPALVHPFPIHFLIDSEDVPQTYYFFSLLSVDGYN